MVRGKPIKKGERRGGRKPGQPNHTTQVLKDAILMAASLSGYDKKGKDELVGYLKHIADDYPTSFVPLLGRVLPLQVNARVEKKEPVIYETIDEVRAAMMARGVNADKIIEVILDGAYKAPPKMLEQKNGKTQ